MNPISLAVIPFNVHLICFPLQISAGKSLSLSLCLPLRLQLPHGVEMNQVEHLLKTMIKSAEWSSRELMRYFRHLLLPIMDTFMEESQD